MSKPFIKHIKLQNFLSFGPDNPGIDLLPLNVLIGPNGCGKSNLIEAISLMRAAASDFQAVTRAGGGAEEWIWKGAPKQPASVDWIVNGKHHAIKFRAPDQYFYLTQEWIESLEYKYDREELSIKLGKETFDIPSEFERNSSILTQQQFLPRFNPKDFQPSIPYNLLSRYKQIRIYQDWALGRETKIRDAQRADARNDRVEEDFSNLGVYLSRLKARFPESAKAIAKGLEDVHEGITGFEILTQGGRTQLYLTEGKSSFPATRLSDGTLRYLSLLAILHDPEPPPVICIEEPELGLHHSIHHKVADLLRETSKRTQLIVTTHSDILVDALTETPESIVVCEKHDGQTTFNRLNPKELSKWLEKYSLGDLWTSGEIGGNRW
jgi:predicted ATPase